MSGDAHELPPLVHELPPQIPALHTDLTYAAEARLTLPTDEQIRAADGVFAPGSEQETVANLLGLWSSALILRDLAADAMETPEEESTPPDNQPKGPKS